MGKDNCHDPKPGDLIEIYRPGYQHWALYLGDGYVIHVAPEDKELPSSLRNMAFVLAGKAKVKKELLEDVAVKNKWTVNNKYDRSYTPYSVDKIIWLAKQWIDKEVPYDVLTNNCEHFVTELRYGKRRSDQVRKIVAYTVAGTILASIVFPGAASAIVKLCHGKIFFKMFCI